MSFVQILLYNKIGLIIIFNSYNVFNINVYVYPVIDWQSVQSVSPTYGPL